ncbi:MAG TPA: amidohydrolase family protein [Rhodopila sp.]|nr:amidohydrolase family protein [Rhodopila sp.]
MTSILIDGAWICSDGTASPGGVLVQGKRIGAVAFTAEDRAGLRARAEQVLDASGHWLIPGMIDAHAHAYGTLLRGTENSLPLELWALHTMLYGRAYDDQTLRAAILLGAAERIRGGITGMVDHAPMLHLAETALAAHESSGLRVAYATLLHDVSDYDLLGLSLPETLQPLIGGPPALDAAGYASRFAAIVQGAAAGSGRVSAQLGPNAPQRCSPQAWALWRSLRGRHGVAVHTHLLETRLQASPHARWPDGLVREMQRQGMLDGPLTCAHGVWLSEAEMEILARHDVTLSHNPATNLMLGSGVMRFRSCTACGLRLALGNDAANTGGRADHFAGMRLAMSLPRPDGADFALWPKPSEVFTAATEAGAAALGLKGSLGRIAAGQFADLVLVRSGTAGTLAARPALDVLVQHGGPEHVDSVMVDGRWVMREGHILAFDEAAILADAQAQSIALQQRAAPDLAVLLAAMPGIAARFPRGCS